MQNVRGGGGGRWGGGMGGGGIVECTIYCLVCTDGCNKGSNNHRGGGTRRTQCKDQGR